MSDFRAVPLGPQGPDFAEQGGFHEQFRTTVNMRLGLLAGAVVALVAVAAGASAAGHASFASLRAVPSLEMAFAVVSAMCTFGAVFLVPLLLPTDSEASGAPCALRSARPTRAIVCGRLCTRAAISGAMSEVAAVLGFLLLAIGAEAPVYLALFAVTILSSALTFPRRDVWEAAMAEADDEAQGIG